MAPFTSITALSSLNLGGVSYDDIHSWVTALTHLQCLDLDVSVAAEGPVLGLQDLLPLTVLTSLTGLWASSRDTEDEYWDPVNLQDNVSKFWPQLLCVSSVHPAVACCLSSLSCSLAGCGPSHALQIKQQRNCSILPN